MLDADNKDRETVMTKQERAVRQQQILEKKRQARAEYNTTERRVAPQKEERREKRREKQEMRAAASRQKKKEKKKRIFERGYLSAVAFDDAEGVSASQWFLSICWLKIPVFGFFYAVYLAVSSKVHPAKKNFARGYLVYRCLVLMLALTILYVLYRVGLSFVDEILQLAQ